MSGDDFHLALLDLRNTLHDNTLGSPMQHLHGRRAQTRLPIADSLLKLATVNPSALPDKMMEYRRKQKLYYDRGAKPLKPIKEDDASGWKPAEYTGPHHLTISHNPSLTSSN